MKILALLGVLCLAVQSWATEGKHWGLLVAGANTFTNYAFQADVCHAYQVLKAHGIPDEQIVVMMYDDIAYNPQNPDKGSIINRPNGPNVYPGVPKDYTGDDVTPEIFLKVLQGQKTGTGSGKVINSGPNDNIFVFMSDHGGPGTFVFPSKYLYVAQLNDALKSMYKAKQYKQMVIYMEACDSGSMFYKDLPKNINIFATTAASPTEPSYACYWDDHLEVYLASVYSVKWMEDSEREDLSVETLLKQYMIVKKETKTSHVQRYGDTKMGSDVLDDFQGNSNGTGHVFDPFKSGPITDAVPSYDIPLQTLEKKILSAGKYSNVEILKFIEQRNDLLLRRERNVAIMETIAGLSGSNRVDAKEYFLKSRQQLTQHECYQTAVDKFDQICFAGKLAKEPFAMQQMYVLINMCEDRVPMDNMVTGMRQACLY